MADQQDLDLRDHAAENARLDRVTHGYPAPIWPFCGPKSGHNGWPYWLVESVTKSDPELVKMLVGIQKGKRE